MNVNEKRWIEAAQKRGEESKTRKEIGSLITIRLIGVGIFEVLLVGSTIGIIRHSGDRWVFVAAHDISAQDQAEIERILETLNG